MQRDNFDGEDRMIEFCSKKRMAVIIVLLIGVSVIVLFYENSVSMGHNRNAEDASENKSRCWNTVKTEVVEECGPCSQFDRNVQEACKKTGFKEKINCIDSDGKTESHFRSCAKYSWVEERNFWIFESAMAAVGVGAYTVMLWRQRLLDKLMLEKVHRQVAAGV